MSYLFDKKYFTTFDVADLLTDTWLKGELVQKTEVVKRVQKENFDYRSIPTLSGKTKK